MLGLSSYVSIAILLKTIAFDPPILLIEKYSFFSMSV